MRIVLIMLLLGLSINALAKGFVLFNVSNGASGISRGDSAISSFSAVGSSATVNSNSSFAINSGLPSGDGDAISSTAAPLTVSPAQHDMYQLYLRLIIADKQDTVREVSAGQWASSIVSVKPTAILLKNLSDNSSKAFADPRLAAAFLACQNCSAEQWQLVENLIENSAEAQSSLVLVEQLAKAGESNSEAAILAFNTFILQQSEETLAKLADKPVLQNLRNQLLAQR